ncbi:MAG: hypothetical protein IPK52_21630 [Chloroflexi bacterium]|nr:hypothetical protein [Chloroflexota bacterium]
MTMKRPGPTWPDEHITDAAPSAAYFHFMLNMADDDLDPYEYRLLGHYRRVCGMNGTCTQSVRDIAKACKMSRGMVTKTRDKLAAGGWITARRNVENGLDKGYTVKLIDRMRENTERYAAAKDAHQAQTEGVHTVDTCPPGGGGVHQVKQRINKNKNQPTNTSHAGKAPAAVRTEPQSYATTSGKSDAELLATRDAVETEMRIDDDRRLHRNEQRALLLDMVAHLFKVSGPFAQKYVAMLEGRQLQNIRANTAWNEAAAYLKGAPVTADELYAWSKWYRQTILGGNEKLSLTSKPESLVSSILAYRETPTTPARATGMFAGTNYDDTYWERQDAAKASAK